MTTAEALAPIIVDGWTSSWDPMAQQSGNFACVVVSDRLIFLAAPGPYAVREEQPTDVGTAYSIWVHQFLRDYDAQLAEPARVYAINFTSALSSKYPEPFGSLFSDREVLTQDFRDDESWDRIHITPAMDISPIQLRKDAERIFRAFEARQVFENLGCPDQSDVRVPKTSGGQSSDISGEPVAVPLEKVALVLSF